MSTSVQDIFAAIGDAQRALQAEPSYRNHIEELQKQLDASMRHSQALETNILGYKGTVDTLQAKVRSLEVERDDTGFRLLETEDKLDKLVKVVRSCELSLGDAINNVDPKGPRLEATHQDRVVKPEPIAPQATMAQALHTPSPEPSPSYAGEAKQSQTETVTHHHTYMDPAPTASPEGQSVADPTVQSMESPFSSPSAILGDAYSGDSAVVDKPYAGKSYREWPGYVSEQDWLNGGGSHDGYWNF